MGRDILFSNSGTKNKNSVNNGNLNKTDTVDSYMSILLAFIAFSSDANLEKRNLRKKKFETFVLLFILTFLSLTSFLSGGLIIRQ